MIRRGRAEGWFQLPSASFRLWIKHNEIQFAHTVPGAVDGKGSALLAEECLDDNKNDYATVLMVVPKDLILSLGRVQEHAKEDKEFREVLESLGDFGRTARGAILSFLLVQASLACFPLLPPVSRRTAFTDYIRSLPFEDLPTFWPPSELQLLTGTTLAPAVMSKLRSLQREYDHFCSCVANTRWYQMIQHHNAMEGRLDFDDWLQVDSMYRSRALDFPGVGHCMVPCIDLANHAAGADTVAIYELDVDGNAILMLRDGITVPKGGEVTITYGDEKGACEMLFSYGFLDEARKSAEMLYLSLAFPDGDLAAEAKMKAAGAAPGFKVVDAGDNRIEWAGDFIWLLCVNFDDGLRCELARTTDGEEEVQAFFNGTELVGGAAQLRQLLEDTELWDVYRLRAITILQERVRHQLRVLSRAQDEFAELAYGEGTEYRVSSYENASKLRRLEWDLMNNAYDWFEIEQLKLAKSPVVTRYLAEMNGESADPQPAQEEDFS